MGVRLPGRDHDRHFVRRQAEQQAGELPGQAVQRRRGRAVAEAGRPGRELSGQPVGPARHARQRVRVVPGLVPLEATGRRGPRPALRAKPRRWSNRERQRVPGAPGRVLGRRGLALPVGLPPAVRARAAITTTSAFASPPSGRNLAKASGPWPRAKTLHRTGPRVVLRGFNVFPTAPVGELSRLPDTEEVAKAHPDLRRCLRLHVIKGLCVFQAGFLPKLRVGLQNELSDVVRFAVVAQTSTGNSLGHESRCIRNVPSNSLNTEADGLTFVLPAGRVKMPLFGDGNHGEYVRGWKHSRQRRGDALIRHGAILTEFGIAPKVDAWTVYRYPPLGLG